MPSPRPRKASTSGCPCSADGAGGSGGASGTCRGGTSSGACSPPGPTGPRRALFSTPTPPLRRGGFSHARHRTPRRPLSFLLRFRSQARGVCHTDLHYREGGIGEDFPYLLGHGAAGVVEQVGEGVSGLAPGDFVILNWRAVCGQCRACRRGRPWYCFATHNATQKMTLSDGTILSPALGIGAFAEKTLVAAGQCTKVSPQVKPEVAGLLGCGVIAGLGAALNTGQVGRGDSVAVIRCGGVGCGAVLGARLAGARTIIAVDIDDRKLALASDFGATHTVNVTDTDAVAAIQAL